MSGWPVIRTPPAGPGSGLAASPPPGGSGVGQGDNKPGLNRPPPLPPLLLLPISDEEAGPPAGLYRLPPPAPRGESEAAGLYRALRGESNAVVGLYVAAAGVVASGGGNSPLLPGLSGPGLYVDDAEEQTESREREEPLP